VQPVSLLGRQLRETKSRNGAQGRGRHKFYNVCRLGDYDASRAWIGGRESESLRSMKRYRAHGVGRRGGREPRHVSRADRIGRTCNTGRYAGSIAGGRRQPGALDLKRGRFYGRLSGANFECHLAGDLFSVGILIGTVATSHLTAHIEAHDG